MIPHPEPDDPEEARRVRMSSERFARLRMNDLRAAAAPGSFEHAFLRRDPATFDSFAFALLDRIAWHYRRRISRSLAPKLNPDDPIARENHGI
jgi:hypothetical protein